MKWTLCLAALVALGCRPDVKIGDGPYADKVADDVPKIEHEMGVKFKTPPKLELRSRDDVRRFLLQQVNDPEQAKQIANQEIALKLLGMIPDTMHLADNLVRLYTEQIIGYYDPKTKVLYVVKDAPADVVGLTLMHELVHALQDQYANVDSLLEIHGDDDRALAAQAVIEGQAIFEQLYIMAGGNGNLAAQLPGGFESIRSTIRDNAKNQPVFSSAPMVLQELALFPYINGADFAHRFKVLRPGKLPFSDLPVSTTQIMHDSAYFGAKPDVPMTITLPSIPGTIDQNVMGEFGTRLYLFQHTHDQDQSIRAAGGWKGDRYALVKTPSGNAFVWVTVWDTPGDAAEFMSAIDAVMQSRFHVLPAVKGELRHFDARTRSIDVDIREMSGHPVVLYVDAPAGSSTHLLDFSQVKVAQQ